MDKPFNTGEEANAEAARALRAEVVEAQDVRHSGGAAVPTRWSCRTLGAAAARAYCLSICVLKRSFT